MAPRFPAKFWVYTQLPAKLAGLLPFTLALFYAAYTFHRPAPAVTAVFFIAMFSFELSVTALNNYTDSKSDGSALPFERKTARRILIFLWVIAGIGAVILVWLEGLVVFAVGGLCTAVGIFYSLGPASISRMPLGELFSGIFEGFFIPFLVVYINSPKESLVWYTFQKPFLTAGFQLWNLFDLAVLSVPAIFCIADIMLANNICDVGRDVLVRRYTLPYYLGTKNALRLYGLLYAAAYGDILLIALFQVLPPYVLIALPGLIAVWRNSRTFRAHPSKEETFRLSITNFLIIMVPLILAAAAAAVI